MRRGRKATDPVESGFWKLSNCSDWVTAVEAFGARPGPVHDLLSRDPPIDVSQRGPLCDGFGYPQKFLRTLRGRPARNWRPSARRGAASGSRAPALGEQAVTGDGCSDTDSMEAQEDTKEGSAGAGGGARRSDEREEAA